VACTGVGCGFAEGFPVSAARGLVKSKQAVKRARPKPALPPKRDFIIVSGLLSGLMAKLFSESHAARVRSFLWLDLRL
jgi:hypothetical protein